MSILEWATLARRNENERSGVFNICSTRKM